MYVTMAKKQPNKATRGRPRGQKSTNTRKTGNNATKGNKPENGRETGLAKIGGDHETFRTLKRKAAMLTALKHSMGIVTPALEMINLSRSVYYNWLKTDPGFREEVNAIEESRYDFVETKMVERINAGSDTMLIWYSKTKMKHRGFIERTEVEVTNTPAFVVKPEQKGVNKVMDIIHKKTGTDK
jgi:hypothetical protein